jgi:hypothetical protein
MIRFLSSALLFAASFAPSPAADVWTISGDVQGYPVNEVCTLTTTGTTIAGSCVLSGKTYNTTGTATDKTVNFKHGGEYNGQDLTLTFAGTLDASGKLQGTIDVDPLAVSGTFTALKSAPAASTPPAN